METFLGGRLPVNVASRCYYSDFFPGFSWIFPQKTYDRAIGCRPGRNIAACGGRFPLKANKFSVGIRL